MKTYLQYKCAVPTQLQKKLIFIFFVFVVGIKSVGNLNALS